MNLTFKEKDSLVRFVFRQQKEIVFRQKNSLQDPQVPYEVSEKLKNQIQCAYELCSTDVRDFLRQEYMEGNPTERWMEYYRRSSYSRIKGKAMDEFLHCLQG